MSEMPPEKKNQFKTCFMTAIQSNLVITLMDQQNVLVIAVNVAGKQKSNKIFFSVNVNLVSQNLIVIRMLKYEKFGKFGKFF